jgi:hypothetical protein
MVDIIHTMHLQKKHDRLKQMKKIHKDIVGSLDLSDMHTIRNNRNQSKTISPAPLELSSGGVFV